MDKEKFSSGIIIDYLENIDDNYGDDTKTILFKVWDFDIQRAFLTCAPRLSRICIVGFYFNFCL